MKKNKKFSILVLLLLVLSFPMLLTSIGSSKAYAASFSSATTQLRLVGYSGYQPADYFDELSRVKAVSAPSYYYNTAGNLTKSYNILEITNSNWFNARSTGSLSFKPFGEYVALANNNVLYAYASTGIVSGADEKNDVTITFSNSQSSVSKSNESKGLLLTSGYFRPHYFATTNLKVLPEQNLSFSFTNNASTNLLNQASFKLFEPSIFFTTKISGVTLKNQNQNTYKDEIVKLDASNAVLDIPENGTLVSHYKNLHKIEYEVLEGADKVSIIGSYLYFTGNTSGKVRLRARSLASSNATNYVYSKEVVYNYVAEEKQVSVLQNFPDGATIYGQGKYYLNQQATLIPEMNAGYTFSHWVHNGIEKRTQVLNITVQAKNDIEFFAIRNVQIDEVQIKQRQYDGTTNAEIEKIVVNGILPSHDAKITNLQASYYTASAGTKMLLLNTLPVLEGVDAKWYRLSEKLPDITGTILARDLVINVKSLEKTYGESDPVFGYETQGLLQGDNINVSLSREAGEDVGKYMILATANNLNYNIQIKDSCLQINQKELLLQNTNVSKTYNQSKSIEFESSVLGIVFSDEIIAQVSAEFSDAFVVENKQLNVLNISLKGNKKQNYFVDLNKIIIFGSIKPKTVYANIESQSKTYGEQDNQFSYTLQGMLEGDILNERVKRPFGENVGEYLLGLEIENLNYKVELIGGPTLTIEKRIAKVIAEKNSKVYGDKDDKILYQTENVLKNDVLNGNLTRKTGENVGDYEILIGDLNNENYVLNFTSNTYQILQRVLSANITFKNKVYDGTNVANDYTYVLSNIVFGENVTLALQARFKTSNVGQNIEIEIIESEINSLNYKFVKEVYYGDITKRNLYVNTYETVKVYGEKDPQILFSLQNLVEQDTVFGQLERVDGESVGNYQIHLGSLTGENNPNYNVLLVQNGSFVINKRNVNITTLSQEKYFDVQDPEVVFSFYSSKDNLVGNDKLENIISGKVNRVEGETPGRYAFIASSIYSLNPNYNLVYIPSGALSILKANLTITALSTNKVYGDIDPVFEYELNKEVSTNFEFNLIRQQGEAVGNYKINYLSIYHEFYEITFVEGFLSILPRTLEISPISQTKFYGDNDPQSSYQIISGILINGDTLQSVLNGSSIREAGENVGSYTINIGTLNTLPNYTLCFVKKDLKILPQEIEITAKNTHKHYKQAEEVLQYEITKGKLAFSDKITGNLQREQGEQVGKYKILQGSISLNSNYTISFVSAEYNILKSKITIKTHNLQKEYGNLDPEFTYDISGNYYASEPIKVVFSREVGEQVGNYKIFAQTESEIYEPTFELEDFVVTKRIIQIKSNSYTITYGQNLPQLEYQIVSGTILPQDSLTGNIYKAGTNNAGTYDINSTLNLGRNYQIEYQKGTVTILPIKIKIISDGASKVYGQPDPHIPYEIFDGEVLKGDELTGRLQRVQGEDIGIYKLVSGFTNANYQVEILTGKFQIFVKEVNLFIVVEDKVFDNTTQAIIKQAEVVGLLDEDVRLEYSKQTSAIFESKEVANKIKIEYKNMFLMGEKAFNYKLVFSDVFANITFDKIKNNNIEVYALNNTQLKQGVSFEVVKSDSKKEENFKGKNIVSTFALNLSLQNEKIELEKDVTIKVDLYSDNFQNIKVYLLDSENNYTLIDSTFKNGSLTFNTNKLGKVIIVSDNVAWLDIASIVSVAILCLFGGAYVYFNVKKNKKTKEE